MYIPPELPNACAIETRLGLQLFHVFSCTRMVGSDAKRLATISHPPPSAIHSPVTTERDSSTLPLKPEAHCAQRQRYETKLQTKNLESQ